MPASEDGQIVISPGRILRGGMDARSSQSNDPVEGTGQMEGRLRLLVEMGLLLSAERDLDVIMQAALDAGLALCGAAFGAFLLVNTIPGAAPYELGKVSSVDPAHSAGFSLPRPITLSAPSLFGKIVLRSGDIATDPQYVNRNPFQGLISEPLEVCSLLAVPVCSGGGAALGVLLYGHPQRGVFQNEAEHLVATIAGQVAIAIENSRLRKSLKYEAGVTETARARQRSTEKRLRLALDATESGTWTWSLETGMIDLDERAAELFSVPAHQPMSRAELRENSVYPEDLESSLENLDQVLQSGLAYQTEYRIRQPDGGLRWIASNGVPDVDQRTGRILGLTGTVQDITARKSQEEALRQSEKLAATGRLAATIAHEINNPLEAVTNLIYLAKTDPAAPPAIGSLLETADAELARVSQIAQQTLGFYRDTTRPMAIDVNELLGAVVDLFGRKLAGKQLNVKLDLEPGLSVIGLQGEIRQVVSNLLVNAIDASPPSSAIRIRGRHRCCNGLSGVSVLISDLGTGIPSHLHRQLFTPFVTTKQSRGTGLGLWVTRGMVEKHGGTVRFRSRVAAPAGTVFRVYLPQTGTGRVFASQSTALIQ